MKKLLIATIAVASFSTSTTYANEVFSDLSYTSGLSGVKSEAVENLTNCLQADMEIASSKAILKTSLKRSNFSMIVERMMGQPLLQCTA